MFYDIIYGPKGCAHLLFMFYPFLNECDLKVGQAPSYTWKLSQLCVLEIINHKCSVESYIDLVNNAFLNYRLDISPIWGNFLQEENEDVENELLQN